MEHKPAGWYRNKLDRRQHGYWDGFAWVDPNPIDPTPTDAEPTDAEPTDAEPAVPSASDDEPADPDDPMDPPAPGR